MSDLRTSKAFQECQGDFFKIVSDLAASFGSPARLKILQILSQAPRSVQEISEITGETVANTSQHLQRLLSESLVAVKKEKLSRIYSLSNPRIALLIESLFDVAECVSQDFVKVDEKLKDESLQHPEDFENILRAVENKKALFVDVRDVYESEQSPVDGAISLPLETLKDSASVLQKNKTYFVFCRGRFCSMANEGVNILRSLGFKAYRVRKSAAIINRKGKLYE